MLSDAGIIILTGALAAAACALPGTFLLLRGMSLLGDAISHAVLPGIVVAFLLTGSMSTWPVVLGAGLTGLLAVVLIEALIRTRRVKEDASIAVVFPALFALGVLLIASFAGQVDLDQDCVLHGEIAYAPLDVVAVGGLEVARPALVLGVVAALNLLLVLLLYKELQISSFDGAFASAVGLSPAVVHYLLMGSVSLTTVASFESIGAILVIAFLIVPPAAARLLTDRLGLLLVLSVAIGVASSTAGYLVARELDASIAGTMAACMGVAFLLAWIVSPRRGLVARLLVRRRQRDRVADALTVERLAREPRGAKELAALFSWSPDRAGRRLDRLEGRGLVARQEERYHATEEGLAFAREVGSGG
jgi:manganese/zinc/iron transport system permease protein